MYLFARAAVTGHFKRGGLNSRNLLCQVLKVRNLSSRCHQGQFLLRAVRMAVPCLSLSPVFHWPSLLFFSLSIHHPNLCALFTWRYLCVYLCVQIAPLNKNINHTGSRPTLIMSFCLEYLCKGPITK